MHLDDYAGGNQSTSAEKNNLPHAIIHTWKSHRFEQMYKKI